MSKSLQPHGLKHTRLPCPSLSPGDWSNSCPLIWWCYLTISSSATLFSFCLQSFPTSGSLSMSWLFTSNGQSIGASALASVLASAPQFQSINSSALSLLYGSTLTSIHDYWKNHRFDYTHLCWERSWAALVPWQGGNPWGAQVTHLGCFLVLSCLTVTEKKQARPPWLRGISDLSEMKVWVTRPGQPLRPAEVVEEDVGTLEWILERRRVSSCGPWANSSLSNAWKWEVKVKLLSRVRLLATPWTAAFQAPPSMDFPGKSTGVGCHCLLQKCTYIPINSGKTVAPKSITSRKW